MDCHDTVTPETPPDESRPSGDRNALGQWAPRNRGALKTGMQSAQVEQDALAAMSEEIDQIARGDHRPVVRWQAELIAKWAWLALNFGDRLQVEGPTTRTGRTKGIFKAFDTATNQVGRIAERIGFDPRSKRGLGDDFGPQAYAAMTPDERAAFETLMTSVRARIAAKALPPLPEPTAAPTHEKIVVRVPQSGDTRHE